MIRVARPSDLNDLSRLYSDAFFGDPVDQWLFPDVRRRKEIHPAYFRALLSSSMRAGSVLVMEDLSGALAFSSLAENTVDAKAEDYLQMLRKATYECYGRVLEFEELLSSSRPKKEAYFYLQAIAVDPESQGMGVGGKLVREFLDLCDSLGQSAYLETTTKRSLRLYRRYGFKPYGQVVEVPGGPTCFPAWRESPRVRYSSNSAFPQQ